MPRRLALLLNPNAGRGRAPSLLEPVRRRLEEGAEVRPLLAHGAGEASRLLSNAIADGTDGVVVVGGDGTISMAVQAVAGTGIPVGVIPAGNGNDVARMLGIPYGAGTEAALAAADVIGAGRTRDIDAGRAGSRWFLTVLSSGFDSRVTERANRLTWPRGRVRYPLAIAAELRAFRPVPYVLTLDGVELPTRAMLVAVGNGPSYGGGMRVCPTADLQDGRLDVTVLTPLPTLAFVRVFPSVYRGRHVRHPAVLTRRARSVSLSAPAMTAYADGESLGPLPMTVEAVRGAVTVFVP